MSTRSINFSDDRDRLSVRTPLQLRQAPTTALRQWRRWTGSASSSLAGRRVARETGAYESSGSLALQNLSDLIERMSPWNGPHKEIGCSKQPIEYVGLWPADQYGECLSALRIQAYGWESRRPGHCRALQRVTTMCAAAHRLHQRPGRAWFLFFGGLTCWCPTYQFPAVRVRE